MLSDRQASLVFSHLPHIGAATLRKLIAAFGSPAAALQASRTDLRRVPGVGPQLQEQITHWRDHVDLTAVERRLEEATARFLIPGDDAFPRLLGQLYDPPIGLYARGPYEGQKPCVALVGTRRPTLYGKTVAFRFAEALAARGIAVVSGLAAGVDRAAHEGALKAGGTTVAVLGTGLDIVYPPANLDLFRQIAAEGLLLTEFPFGRRADRQTFPQRNRLISGMSDAIVVIESDLKGGSLITARFALDQNRTVCAVPGRIDVGTARGCHQLIREGATLVTSVDDIFAELEYLQGRLPFTVNEAAVEAPSAPAELAVPPDASPEERAVAACFAAGALLHPDEVAAQSNLPSPQVATALMSLELRGLLAKRADGRFEGRLDLSRGRAS